MGTDQAAYQSRTLFRKHFFSEVCLCLSTDCTLDALSTCDWRQINLGMIVTSKSFSPCYSFKTGHWDQSFVLKVKRRKKIYLALALTLYLACSHCVPTCIFPVCLEELGPLNTNGHHNLHLWEYLTQVAMDQGRIFFFFFCLQKLIVWKYFHSVWYLRNVFMLCPSVRS